MQTKTADTLRQFIIAFYFSRPKKTVQSVITTGFGVCLFTGVLPAKNQMCVWRHGNVCCLASTSRSWHVWCNPSVLWQCARSVHKNVCNTK